jgi:hypothetical protein
MDAKNKLSVVVKMNSPRAHNRPAEVIIFLGPNTSIEAPMGI